MRVSTISYVTGPNADPVRHCLDLYRPEDGGDLPVLLFAHGGVWQLGSKDEYRNIGEAFASRGILTAVINYRLTPGVRHPAHAEDVADGGFPRYIHPPFGEKRVALQSASPVTHLRPTRVPILIVLAGEDYRAMRRQSAAFVDALKARSIDATFETVAGREHFELVHAIGRPNDPTTELIARFVR